MRSHPEQAGVVPDRVEAEGVVMSAGTYECWGDDREDLTDKVEKAA